MNNSPTEGATETTGLQEQPTSQEQMQQSAEQNQETNSGANTQESVSDDTATGSQGQEQTQTQQTGGESQTDDGLANFAKSQGFDLETAGEDVKRALKIAHDNQKAFRSGQSQKITDASKTLKGSEQSIESRIEEIEYKEYQNTFWNDPQAKRDRSLESEMVEILYEKQAKLAPVLGEEKAREHAFNLSRDLDTLYELARVRKGATSSVDVEAIRREERESINKQMSAAAPAAHAVQGGSAKTPKVTDEWIRNEYDPRNPEHIKMMQEAGLR
jgi:hypothetical protein